MSFLSRIIEGFLNPPIGEKEAVDEILYVGSEIPSRLADEFPDLNRSDIAAIWERGIVLLVKIYREDCF